LLLHGCIVAWREDSADSK